MTPTQKEIKEALDGVSFPWAFDEENGTIWNVDGHKVIDIPNWVDSETAEFMAYAPEWLLHQQELIEQKDAEIEKLREIQRALVLTPMQKMSRAMDTISQFNEKEGM